MIEWSGEFSMSDHMGRNAAEAILECVDCRGAIDRAPGRGYRHAGDWGLCFACALERGGQYDENEDCWLVPPDIDSLLVDREHKVR